MNYSHGPNTCKKSMSKASWSKSLSGNRWTLHDRSLARDAVIISRRCYANSISYPSESTSSSKWHVWFASRCPGRRLSAWPTMPSRVRLHSAFSAVSWRFDLRGAANTQQLWRQNFCSHRNSLWNSLPVQLRNPNITYGLFRWQLKGHLSQAAWQGCDFWYAAP